MEKQKNATEKFTNRFLEPIESLPEVEKNMVLTV